MRKKLMKIDEWMVHVSIFVSGCCCACFLLIQSISTLACSLSLSFGSTPRPNQTDRYGFGPEIRIQCEYLNLSRILLAHQIHSICINTSLNGIPFFCVYLDFVLCAFNLESDTKYYLLLKSFINLLFPKTKWNETKPNQKLYPNKYVLITVRKRM